MTDEQRVEAFVDFARRLDGDEKGEAQTYLDRLFQAFGHAGAVEAGATFERRVRRRGRSTGFADLVWGDTLLVEMKKRGEPLQKHYDQVRDYWFNLFPKPRYVVLCNFDELWVYDFDVQHDPVDKVPLADLPARRAAFAFLRPGGGEPVFGNNRVAVTREAAGFVAEVYRGLVEGGEDAGRAQHFVLQCVVAMFAEDTGLLPDDVFTRAVDECLHGDASAYDLLGGLFRQMADPRPARGGRFAGVPYFNGGLFSDVEPVPMGKAELFPLYQASLQEWRRVQPEVFGTLFQGTMDAGERHAQGAHFTHEADIQKIVQPTVVRPWRERIGAADRLADLLALRDDLLRYRVLDPACGSGNFLYVAFRELKRLEIELLVKLRERFSAAELRRRGVALTSRVGVRQLYGIDRNPFAVELARVTLTIAKELALREAAETADAGEVDLTGQMFDEALPLDDLRENVRCADALFDEWPAADAVVGNPPFVAKNKLVPELGAAYVDRVRRAFPYVSGRADLCVYWFRRAHDHIREGGRAGLVGTNTIRQNESREGGLDYVVDGGGTITEAVSSQVWSGDAAVHVSIVNWVKGEAPGPKKLFRQDGDRADSPFVVAEVETIHPALADRVDLREAAPLRANTDAGACFQGQTHGHAGFLLSPTEAAALVAADPASGAVVHPYMTGADLLTTNPPRPKRYAIDFYPLDVFAAARYKAALARVRERVLPDREAKRDAEVAKNEKALAANPKARVNRHHQNFYATWWQFSYPRGEMLDALDGLPRYVVCVRVTRRPIFAVVSTEVRPNDALVVFPFADDYTFGVLQSDAHWQWFTARCSTLKGDYRYTSSTVFDSFPWPQGPTRAQAEAVAGAGRALRAVRRRVMAEHGLTLRALYQMLDGLPGANPLADAHAALDAAVRAAYGMPAAADPLAFLLALNLRLATVEAEGGAVVGPGPPPSVPDPAALVSADAVGG